MKENTQDEKKPLIAVDLQRGVIKPCPFCGPDTQVDADFNGFKWMVICGACGSSSGHYKTRLEAVNGWGRRAV